METEKCKFRYKMLKVTFALCVVSVIAFLYPIVELVDSKDVGLMPQIVAAAALVVMIPSYLLYLLFTGLLASSLGRSVVMWVGATFLATSFIPVIGLVISFVVVRGKVLESEAWKNDSS